MQRLFSAFPDGRPGVGLLLLRATVGLLAVLQSGHRLVDGADLSLRSGVFDVLALLSGTSLLIGLLTPLAGVTLGVSTVLLRLSVPAAGLVFDNAATLLIVADAAAIALLGPGAFSVDGRLFGRREILLPHDPHPPPS